MSRDGPGVTLHHRACTLRRSEMLGFLVDMASSCQNVPKWDKLCLIRMYCIHPKQTQKLKYSAY